MENTPTPALRMTAEEALGWLRQAVDTQGDDFIYCRAGGICFYMPQPVSACNPDDPRSITGCLVGVAMTLAGREVTESLEGQDPQYLTGVWWLTVDAGYVLQAAQKVQDAGSTWGAAYVAAVTCHEELQKAGRYTDTP